MTWHQRYPGRYVGCFTGRNEKPIWRDLFKDAQIPIEFQRVCGSTMEPPSWAIYTKREEDVMRAREIRRGFKVALTLRGDPYDFMLGLRAGMLMREREDNKKLAPGPLQLTDGRRVA